MMMAIELVRASGRSGLVLIFLLLAKSWLSNNS